MSQPGAPQGNKNAANAHRTKKALERALARSANGDVDAGLDPVMDRVAGLAVSGERWAVEFVRDTLDGKPKQQTELSGPDGTPLPSMVEVRLVRASG